MLSNPTRKTSYPIEPAFTDRWSAYSFKHEPIDEEVLMSFFEAARWAPSSYNSQPWRFIYALNDGSSAWNSILSSMHPLNQAWAAHASALVVLVARNQWVPPNMDEEVSMPWSGFDCGSAFMSLSLQASLTGWHTHAVGGFNQESIRAQLKIPEDYDPLLIVAIGKHDPAQENLPQDIRSKEKISSRQPLERMVFRNQFDVTTAKLKPY